MTRLIPARRRAERFASLVEAGAPDGVDSSTAELLELVGALRSLPETEARPEFVSDLRGRLLAAAATELAPVAGHQRDEVARLTVKPASSRRERRIALALGTVAVVGATSSMAYASQGAIPGDALYPLKRAIENTQAGFSRGDDAKGEAMLGNASERLDEVRELSQKPDPDAELVNQTLNTFIQQFTDGGNALLADYEQNGHTASIHQLHQDAAHSIDALSNLADTVPPAAHDALVDAAGVVLTLDAQAQHVCPDPDCGSAILDVPGQLVADAGQGATDALGAVAGGALAGTSPSAPAQPSPGNGVKGHGGKPSGLNPPETPIQLPATPTDSATGVLGGVLPTTGTDVGDTGGTAGDGGSGGKHKHKPTDQVTDTADQVTDTVDQVVSGVVDGVSGVLGGLTGGTTTGLGN